MNFDRHHSQDMETLSSSPSLNDKLEPNCSSEFKSPNTSSFCDQNVKSSTPLTKEENGFCEELTRESQEQPQADVGTNGFFHFTRDTQANQTQHEPASSSDWFGLAVPKFGTYIRSRIFVGGISSQTTEDELTSLFSQFGYVKASKIIVDRAGVSKGYGFVTFETEKDSEALCNLIKNKEIGPIMLRERRLNVAPAVKKQIGYRSDFPYPVNSGPPNPQVWRDNGYTGQGLYNAPAHLAVHNQVEEYWQVQTQFPGGPQIAGLVNPGMPFQQCMPFFFPPQQPQTFPNYQVPCYLPDGSPSYQCPASPWFNFPPAYPSLATQDNNANRPFLGNTSFFGQPTLPTPEISQLGPGTAFDCFPGKDKIRSFNTNGTTYFPCMADSTNFSLLQQSTNQNDTVGNGHSSDDSLPPGITCEQHPTTPKAWLSACL